MAGDSATKRGQSVQILEWIVLVVVALYFGRPILLPLALAILLTFLLSPVVSWLERLGLPRVLSIILVILVIVGILVFGGLSLTAQLADLAENIPTYADNLRSKLSFLKADGTGILASLQDTATQLSDELGVKPRADEPVEVRIKQSNPLSTFWGALAPLLTPLATFLVIIVLAIFMLIGREDLRNRLVRLAGKSNAMLTTKTLDEVGHRISRYLLMNSLVNGGFGLAIGIGLAVIGVQYASMWGVLAAVLRFVPYIGPIMASVLPVGLAIVQFPGWTRPALAAGLFIVLELFTNNVVEPMVYGRSTGISTVALLVAATFWTWLWGGLGLVLSVPLTVVLAVLGKYVPHLEPLAILLGDDPALETDVNYYQRLLARDQDEAAEILEEHCKAHSREEVYDNVVVPALLLAERDRARGELLEADEQFIWRATRDIVEELGEALERGNGDGETEGGAPVDGRFRAHIAGCPAHDEADELALTMLKQLLAPHGAELEIISLKTLASETLAAFEKRMPDLVCISALGPGGTAQTRYLSKRIRQSFPELKIMIGRWGFRGNMDRTAQRLKAAGADEVVTSLVTARDYLVKWIQPILLRGTTTSPLPAEPPAARVPIA